MILDWILDQNKNDAIKDNINQWTKWAFFCSLMCFLFRFSPPSRKPQTCLLNGWMHGWMNEWNQLYQSNYCILLCIMHTVFPKFLREK